MRGSHMHSQQLLGARLPARLARAAARLDLEDVKREQQFVRQHLQRVLYEPPAACHN